MLVIAWIQMLVLPGAISAEAKGKLVVAIPTSWGERLDIQWPTGSTNTEERGS